MPYETPQEDKRIWGRLAYIMNGAGALGRLKPTHVRVYYEGRKEEADVLVGLVTSTTSVGGFKATKDLGISLNDGLYEMILVRATKNLAEFNLAATRALRLDFDNAITALTNTPELREQPVQRAPFDLFADFYQTQNGQPMDAEMQAYVRGMLDEIEGGNA